MWKAGQCVTVCGRRYRVTKANNYLGIVKCDKECAIYKIYTNSISRRFLCFYLCYCKNQKLEDGLYLKEIHGKDTKSAKSTTTKKQMRG